MENETNDEVIIDDVEANNDEVTENTEVKAEKSEKPKRTPQEELEYFEGRAARLRKKMGMDQSTSNEVKKAPTEKPNDLDYGQLALLRTEGIKGSEELALFKEVMSETGKGVLDVLDSNYFKSRLSDLRDAKAVTDATPKGKNRSSQTGITDIDIAVAKYKDTGELPSDFETRNKVVDIITKQEKGDLFQFKPHN